MRPIALALLLSLSTSPALAQQRPAPRARDLGVPFSGATGTLNAITAVPGVEVGHTTLISGDGRLVVGKGPVRTGVTAVLPRGRASADPVFAAWFTLNGNGEMTGTTWVEESGEMAGPVMITNTHSVGIVRDAVVAWQVKHDVAGDWSLPVVAETWDGSLNDINGFHVTAQHTFDAIDGARGGAVAEGSVGGGTGMVCHQFKGGIGTSSRTITVAGASHTVGVLVQCNYGLRSQLRIGGTPLGQDLATPLPCFRDASLAPPRARVCGAPPAALVRENEEVGSIIIVVATDVPLLPHQLKRVVKRAALGIGRMGGIGGNGSGDIFVAFSTARTEPRGGVIEARMIPNDSINPVFDATIQATEEAIVNAIVAGRTMVGANSFEVPGLPRDALRAALAKYNRLAGAAAR